MSSEWPSGSNRIFISYARDDAQDLAVSLRDDLAAAGHDVWLDLAEIAAGASWAKDIEEAIENCDLVLVLLSHGSYVSDVCRSEQLRAIRKEKRIIPVLVQPDADRPLHMENMNYVDFANPDHYNERFQDLIGYITTGYLPHHTYPVDAGTGAPPMFPPPKVRHTPATGLKRDTRAFRRYLEDLREEPWLGERHWWTYALFYYSDVQSIAEVLTQGVLFAPGRIRSDNDDLTKSGRRRVGLWDKYVRLNFRPRTPDLYGLEGLLPATERMYGHVPVPVYLLFDLESIITMGDSRFSNGDVIQTGKTYKSAVAFRDLPFDLMYHDAPFSRVERDEILSARRAQVLVPGAIGLEHVRHIWCRSAAEYETLRYLLPDKAWHRWGDRITARTDYELFNRRRLFVQDAELMPEGAHFAFNPCHDPEHDECGPFKFEVKVTATDGTEHVIDLGQFLPEESLAIDLTTLPKMNGYTIQLFVDSALAYYGRLHGA